MVASVRGFSGAIGAGHGGMVGSRGRGGKVQGRRCGVVGGRRVGNRVRAGVETGGGEGTAAEEDEGEPEPLQGMEEGRINC